MKKLFILLGLACLCAGAAAQTADFPKGPDYFTSVEQTVGKVVRFYHQRNLLKSVGPYMFYKDGSAYKPYKQGSTYEDVLGSNITVVEIIKEEKESFLRLRPAAKDYDGRDYYVSTRRFDPSKHMRSVSAWRELLKSLPERFPYADGRFEKYSGNKAPRLAGRYLKVKWRSYSAPKDFKDPVMYNYTAGEEDYNAEYSLLYRNSALASEFISQEQFEAAAGK